VEILIVDLLNYHENPNVTNVLDYLASFVCIARVNKPSRFSTNSTSSLLDHMCTNICDEQRITHSGITLFDISDQKSMCKLYSSPSY